MKYAHVLIAVAWSALVTLPTSLTAQTDTTRRRDTTQTRDTTRMRDTMRMRDTTGMRRGGMMMQDTTTRRTRQPRATSQQRLRVQKGEAGGTIEQTRADSIDAMERARRDSVDMAMQRQRDSLAAIESARNDSIARVERARNDSIARVEAVRRDSIARADSITAAEEARRRELARYRFGGRGWYVGLAGGASAPTDEFKNLGYNSGFNVNVPIGWHRPNSLLGIRLDFNYNQFSGRTFTGTAPAGSAVTLENPNPQVLSATANITAALPVNLLRNISPYIMGGGGLYNFRSFGGNSALGGFLGNDVLATNEAANKTTRNKLGAQVGLGLDWTVGTSAVYVESRFVNVFVDRDDTVQFRDFFGTNRSKTLQWVPIVLGVKIR